MGTGTGITTTTKRVPEFTADAPITDWVGLKVSGSEGQLSGGDILHSQYRSPEKVTSVTPHYDQQAVGSYGGIDVFGALPSGNWNSAGAATYVTGDGAKKTLQKYTSGNRTIFVDPEMEAKQIQTGYNVGTKRTISKFQLVTPLQGGFVPSGSEEGGFTTDMNGNRVALGGGIAANSTPTQGDTATATAAKDAATAQQVQENLNAKTEYTDRPGGTVGKGGGSGAQNKAELARKKREEALKNWAGKFYLGQ